MADNKKDNNIKDELQISSRYNPALFHYDLNLYVTYRRIENITSALFLITTTLSDSEILKNKLRSQSLESLRTITSFIKKTSIDFGHIRQLSSDVLELSSLISAALWSGALSEMNGSVLLKEVNKVHESVSAYIHSHERSVVLDPAVFQEVDLEIYEMKNKKVATEKSSETVPNLQPQNKITAQQSEAIISRELPIEKKSERRDTIIALLKEKNNLSIKDFITVIPEYSEKTIQRELLSLVEEGIVKKEGERRWSTYSLIQ